MENKRRELRNPILYQGPQILQWDCIDDGTELEWVISLKQGDYKDNTPKIEYNYPCDEFMAISLRIGGICDSSYFFKISLPRKTLNNALDKIQSNRRILLGSQEYCYFNARKINRKNLKIYEIRPLNPNELIIADEKYKDLLKDGWT